MAICPFFPFLKIFENTELTNFSIVYIIKKVAGNSSLNSWKTQPNRVFYANYIFVWRNYGKSIQIERKRYHRAY